MSWPSPMAVLRPRRRRRLVQRGPAGQGHPALSSGAAIAARGDQIRQEALWGHVAHRRHHVRPPRRLAPLGDTLRSPSNCLLLCHSPRFHRHLVPGSNECRLGRRRCFPMRANRYAVTRPAELPRLQPCDARTHESSSKSASVRGLEQASTLPFAGKRRDPRNRHERPASSRWACPRREPQPYAGKSEPKAPI